MSVNMPENLERVAVCDLLPYANNARTHSEEQIAQLASAIRQFGWTNPLVVDADNMILAGHGRFAAAKKLGIEEVPCVRVPLSGAEARAYILADNRLAELAGWDNEMLKVELEFLREQDFDVDFLGFDESALDEIVGNTPEEPKASMADKFMIPPFSTLNAREGWWQERKRQWLALTGDLTQTKEAVLGDGELMRSINDGSSNFDPVLAELMMRWFSPVGGKVLDPFGGEQTKGVVAGVLQRVYHACEFRADQVAVNRNACKAYPNVHYVCGDSEFIDKNIKERGFNFCFTSPPYYDLEVYSKEDMSALGTYEEFMAKYEKIFARCYEMLEDDSFLAIKIGEIRDKKTGIYRNFVGDNISMFIRLGFKYYNEIVLLTAIGTLPVRAGKSFSATRKIGKTHQNILVFVKGDPKRAAEKCGDPLIPDVVFPVPEDDMIHCPNCGHEWIRGFELTGDDDAEI